MKVVISPFTRQAKVYPYWQELIDLIVKKKHRVIQIGVMGERMFQRTEAMFNLPMESIEGMLLDADLFISVDNFLHHMAYTVGVKGIVLFGPSDPYIFGHPTHKNLIKNRAFLRPQQFEYYGTYKWEHKEDGWLEAEEVMTHVNDVLNDKRGETKANKKNKKGRKQGKKKGGASCSSTRSTQRG